MTVPFNFACITEDPLGLYYGIHHIPLPTHSLYGWWYKPWVFSKDFPLSGSILFLDLDLVIIDNIDCLWGYEPNKFSIIRDFVRKSIPSWDKFNSSVFRFDHGEYSHLWDKLILDTTQISIYHGDQDWIFDQLEAQYVYWPDDWIKSYKWEIRDRKDLSLFGDKAIFTSIADVTTNAKILVFHGDPKPDATFDPIIVNNWRV